MPGQCEERKKSVAGEAGATAQNENRNAQVQYYGIYISTCYINMTYKMDTEVTHIMTITPLKSGLGKVYTMKKGGCYAYIPTGISRDSAFAKLVNGRVSITLFSNGSLHVDPV